MKKKVKRLQNETQQNKTEINLAISQCCLLYFVPSNVTAPGTAHNNVFILLAGMCERLACLLCTIECFVTLQYYKRPEMIKCYIFL